MAQPQTSLFDSGAAATPLGNLRAKGGNSLAYATLVVRLPLRKDVGFDLVAWTPILIVTAVMLALNWFDNVHLSFGMLFGGGVRYDDHTTLRNYAFAWLALAIWEHYKRLQEERQGHEPHTLFPGTSRLGLKDFLPFSPRVIAVGVEPGIAFLAGAVLRRLGLSALGWVVMAAAVCFCIAEAQRFHQVRKHFRDVGNLGKEGLWESAMMNERAGRQNGARGSDAIRTGIDGLETAIENRRQGRASDSVSTGGAQ